MESIEVQLHALDRSLAMLEVKTHEKWEALDRQQLLRERALQIAEAGMNRRLEGMNEFRKALEDSEKKYITRTEWDAGHSKLTDTVRDLDRAVDRRLRTLERTIWMATGAVGLIAFLMNIFVFNYRH